MIYVQEFCCYPLTTSAANILTHLVCMVNKIVLWYDTETNGKDILVALYWEWQACVCQLFCLLI